jgi:hypothetical protein
MVPPTAMIEICMLFLLSFGLPADVEVFFLSDKTIRSPDLASRLDVFRPQWGNLTGITAIDFLLLFALLQGGPVKPQGFCPENGHIHPDLCCGVNGVDRNKRILWN